MRLNIPDEVRAPNSDDSARDVSVVLETPNDGAHVDTPQLEGTVGPAHHQPQVLRAKLSFGELS